MEMLLHVFGAVVQCKRNGDVTACIRCSGAVQEEMEMLLHVLGAVQEEMEMLLHVTAWLVAWHSGRTSVSGWRTFPVLRSTCS